MSQKLRPPKREIVDEGDNVDDPMDDVECERERELTPVPARRFRSREPSNEPTIPRPPVLQDDSLKSVIRQVKGDHPFTHELYFTDSLPETSDARFDHLDGYPDYVRVAVMAFAQGHSLVYSADNTREKDDVNRFVIEEAALKGSPTYLVVRNDSVAKRRYFDLSGSFPDVALLKLDKGSADTRKCLLFVVTIDVIRLLLYSGATRFHRGIVIFDDCEYMGDSELGSRYEETLAMLGYSQLVLHFSRISNAGQIARYICFVLKKVVDAVTVESTLAPTRHFVCYYEDGKAESMKLICDEKGLFFEDALKCPKRVAPVKTSTTSEEKKSEVEKGLFELQGTFVRLIRTTAGLRQMPLLFYCHKTEIVEEFANRLTTFNFNAKTLKHNINTNELFEDQLRVTQYMEAYLMYLDNADKESHLVKAIATFAVRGIGIYHSGMLPIFRELTEQLFLQGLIKVVFADKQVFLETNMRFRSIIIQDSRVHIDDGFTRFMTPEEYSEIARYIVPKNAEDSPFIVTVSSREIPVDYGRELFTVKYPSIQSKFKFSPSCVLNLFKCFRGSVHDETIDKAFLLKRIFTNYQRIEAAAAVDNDIRNKKVLLDSLDVYDMDDVSRYDDLKKCANVDRLCKDLMGMDKVKKFLQMGRVVKVEYNKHDFGYGAVMQAASDKTVVVAVQCSKESYATENPKLLRPKIDGAPSEESELTILKIKLTDISRISQYRLQLPQDGDFTTLKPWLQWCFVSEEKICGSFPDLDPVEDMKITDADFVKQWKYCQRQEKEAMKLKNTIEDFDQKWKIYKQKETLEEELQMMKDIKEAPRLDDLHEQFNDIKEFLSPFSFFDNDRLTLKGSFASNLQVPHAVLIADVLFNNKLFEDNCAASTVIPLLAYLIECNVPDELVRDPDIEFESSIKAVVVKYAKFWREKTKESAVLIEKKFHHTLMAAVDRLCTGYCSFDKLCKTINYTNREGYLASYIKQFDDLLAEIHNNQGYLTSVYDEQFWTDFTRIRTTRIHNGFATATIADGSVNISSTILGRVGEFGVPE